MAVIGESTNRIDGQAKVTGAARYTGDIADDGLVHGLIVGSSIPSGRVLKVDTTRALRVDGVLKVFTHLDMPRLLRVSSPPAGDTHLPMQDDQVLYEGQPVAVVIADTFDQAREGARLVDVAYDEASFQTDFANGIARAESRPLFGMPPDAQHGNVDTSLERAEATVRATYATADRHHVPMEPSVTVAKWQGERLILHDAVQGVTLARNTVAQALGIEPSQVEVHCEYVGGGFGCKGFIWPHQLIAAALSREIGRPLRLALTRAQTFTAHGYQPACLQTVQLDATRDGALVATRHDSVLAGSVAGEHVEPVGWGTRSVYACQHAAVTHRVVRLNKGNPTPMRSPIEGIGMVATEIAMDELAFELDINPLELRLRNYTDTDLAHNRPFSLKRLRECYAEGARMFGWPQRLPPSGTLQHGQELVGYGMATAIFQTFRSAASARVTALQSGRLRVETGTQEIGGGTYTVLAQVAAETLSVPVDIVDVVIGDTRLPEGPMSAGSRVTLSAGSAVQAAARNLLTRFSELGRSDSEDFATALRRLNLDRLAADGRWEPERESRYSLYSFGAVYVEVGVDKDLAIPRVRRVVGVYDAGKIVNPKAALSQMTGGIIWGIGQALLERSEMDHTLGRFLSKNLAGYLVPVNADVPHIEAHFIDGFDAEAGPLGARGIGELGGIGIGAAIANAVFHATGQRLRSLPILPEHLLGERE